MSFTQSCFIRKNTPELRSNLERLGISVLMDKGDDTGGILVQYGVATNIWSKVAFKDLASNGVIDCGENEELFVVLAALRDDSDYMQWFVWGKRWMLWKYDCNPHRTQSTTGISSVFIRGHKATVEELMEHFKDK